MPDRLVSAETMLGGHVGVHDDVSTLRGVRSSESKNDVTNGDAMKMPFADRHLGTLSAASTGTPTIRILTESSREARVQSEFAKAVGEYDARSKKSVVLAVGTESEASGKDERTEVKGHGEKTKMYVNGLRLQPDRCGRSE